VAEQVKVVALVSVVRTVVVQPEEDAMPDSGSLTLQFTVTLVLFQPLRLGGGVTVGMMTGLVASALTVVAVVAELFSLLGSGAALVTVAVFVMVPGAVVPATIMTVALAQPARVPRPQVTPDVPAQLPWLVDEDTNVRPPGSVSVTTAEGAGLGPLFVMIRV